eukprot:TRINITY_DN73841_c0_g1_i1.p1 TRINITY_DN73841_c0_g1~~TRINITY_DN73841_c0_g1_i1.p1  ORF type:complete len:873 (-),score=120.67 TRINITY_DN73841_c0_g1_i1:69-2687(-)
MMAARVDVSESDMKLGEEMASRKRKLDAAGLAASMDYHLHHSTGLDPGLRTPENGFRASAACVNAELMDRASRTQTRIAEAEPKECHYISMEFHMGRLLRNSVGTMELQGSFGETLKQLGWKMEQLEDAESDSGLGYGGLGRLAACFLDSLATLELPGWGYTLRFKFGSFRQVLDDSGRQLEHAMPWLDRGYPWEIKRVDVRFPIQFGGGVLDGKWKPARTIEAVAHDVLVPGYKTQNVVVLRSWAAEPLTANFDMFAFNEGRYDEAFSDSVFAQKITAMVYPGDASRQGKSLRIMQEYLLTSASVQDIFARFAKRSVAAGRTTTNWEDLPKKVAIQMNDTHPALAAPEILRILVDDKGLSWEQGHGIMSACVAYTNHTLMPEALEKWPLDLLQELLPRHVEIIKRLDQDFITTVKAKYSTKSEAELESFLENTTILGGYYAASHQLHLKSQSSFDRAAEAPTPTVRMANLSIICGFAVNGVAVIHSDLCKQEVFADFHNLWPTKFQNKTNGVTPRRWIAFANPSLATVITHWLGSDAWMKDAEKLRGLSTHSDDAKLQEEWIAAKLACKNRLWDHIANIVGEELIGPPIVDVGKWLFDAQVKRIHEYKRQLLNLFGVAQRYRKYKTMSEAERAKQIPRVTLIAGKAFYSYTAAKDCIALTNAIARVVNNDPDVNSIMRVYFLPDYNVSLAEKIIPASDLSQHISVAGTEASGTSNMKFQMNGCLLIGTLDGANVEIRECVGEENFFLCGTTADKVDGLRKERAEGKWKPPPSFTGITEYFKTGPFGDFSALMRTLEGEAGFGTGDYFLVGYDFESYIAAQERVEKLRLDLRAWTRASIISTATSGKFSSDRTISEYAKDIWGVKPCPVPRA